MLPVFDIAIDKLRIQSAGKDAARIASDLQNGGWSVGENTDWLFIRELDVSSPENGLRLNASREIRHESERAVYGGSSQAASANAVRFSSFPDVLAFLLRDISEGRGRVWYWEKWVYLFYLPKSEAITQLLWNNISEVAEIFEKLARNDALLQVWSHLSPSHAEILLVRLAGMLNISSRSLMASLDKNEQFEGQDPSDLESVFNSNKKIIIMWRKILTHKSERNVKFCFAAAVAGVALAPQALAQRPGQVIAAFHQSLTRPSYSFDERKEGKARGNQKTLSKSISHPHEKTKLMSDQHEPEIYLKEMKLWLEKEDISEEFSVGPNDEIKVQLPGKIAGFVDSVDCQPPVNPDARQDAKKKVLPHAYKTGIETGVPVNMDFADNRLGEERTDYQFHTGFGGLFYLINAINHPESYELLRTKKEWMEMPSGWTLVYSLAKKLCSQLDGPLLRFLADVAALPSVSDLEKYQHPDLVETLLPLFRRRYQKKLSFDRVLLTAPARVSVSYSHVSVNYDMKSIRLAVRLCGLDVDPGWTPWLGRVIRLHYLSDLF